MALPIPARDQLDALVASRNADAGWGYARGRGSRLEPTCFTLLGLTAAGASPDGGVLARWPRAEGLLIDPQARTANVADNAVALITAQHPSVAAPAFAAGIASALAGLKGVKLPSSSTNRQDNALEGWPWVANTFSWVEPTAWCVLALKQWQRAHNEGSAAGRIREGERLLLDRVCRTGGWNYGNSNVLGKELFAYIPTTAIVLLALQDRRDQEAVRKSVDYLAAHCLDERSGLSVSLAAIALAIHGREIAGIEVALADTWRTTQFLGNLAVTALALYAVAAASDGYPAFRL